MLLSRQQSWLSNWTLLYYDVSEFIHPCFFLRLSFYRGMLLLQQCYSVCLPVQWGSGLVPISQQSQSPCSHVSAVCLLLGTAKGPLPEDGCAEPLLSGA